MSILSWSAAWRIARRDLHIGFRGLRLLFICLLLGVTTLAAIGSLTSAMTAELAARGQVLLGGDVEIAMTQREASAEDKATFAARGALSETIRMRAMAQRTDDASKAVLSELKGVDAPYPLYGTLTLSQGTYAPLAADRVLIGAALAERLGVKAGDRLRFGTADFTIAGLVAQEPDRVGEGFTLGPVALVSLEGMRRTGLIQPGSLYESKYRIRLSPGSDAKTAREALAKAHPQAGWEYKDRENASPGTNRFLERMGQFLSLIGLAALVIAGIGVSNGVSSYLGQKRSGIATLKVLGAQSADIERIYLLQITAVSAAAIACGLALGALLPPVIVQLAGNVLPVQPGFALHPLPLATSAAYGLLIALIFTLPPLSRARTQPAAALFRALVDDKGRADRKAMVRVGLAAAALIGLALVTAREPLFSAAVLGGIAAVLLLLLGLGWLVVRIAARMPRPKRPLLRVALSNLHRPGAQTGAMVVALGLALTLFVTLAAIRTSLDAEISRTVPATAPNLFVLDIPAGDAARFRQSVLAEAPAAKLNLVPALRGTITAFGGQRVADLHELPEGAWFLRGERGVTYSETLPEGSDLTAGEWWPKAYQGEPLVSLDEEAAAIMGLKVGDRLTVSILGTEIDARIASLRTVNWDTMGFNYILVFSPNALASAPHSLTATVTMDAAREGPVTRTILSGFPGASVIDVGAVVTQVSGLLEQMSAAILAATSVAIFAGIAVLIGAIAASRQARLYDSVILKTLGTTRAQILGTQALEYGLLSALLAGLALLLGLGAAWLVVVGVFDFGFAPDWSVVFTTLLGGAAITLGIGLAGSLPLLSVRPAQALRAL